MTKNKSKLKQIIIKESDWISGIKKPEKDYEEVIAWDGKDLFKAYIMPSIDPNTLKKTRIWRNEETIIAFESIAEDYVKCYLPLEKLLKSIPKK